VAAAAATGSAMWRVVVGSAAGRKGGYRSVSMRLTAYC